MAAQSKHSSPAERTVARDADTVAAASANEPSGYDQALVLCRSAVSALVVEAVASAVVALTIVSHADKKIAAIWLVVVWSTLVLRALWCHNLARTQDQHIALWRWALGLGMTLSAVVWGAAVFILSPAEPIQAHPALNIEILAAIFLGSVLLSADLTVAISHFIAGLVSFLLSIHFAPGVDLAFAWGEAVGAAGIALTLIVFTRSLLTQGRHLKASFLDAQEHARVAIEAKSNFIANMSHELRTPLNAIIGFSELIQSQALGPMNDSKFAGYINDIRDSGRHLLDVINDILDLSKIEAGRMELTDETVDVCDVIARCNQLMSTMAEKAGVTLSSKLPQEPICLRVDERSLKQIILNLVSNAVKFTPLKGSVSVALRALASGDVEIAVIDSGIGIAPESIAIAMEPFGQVDTSLARRFEGTGLGLPLVKSLTELQEGRFELESELAAGTTARVTFPAQRRVRDHRQDTDDILAESIELRGAVNA